MGILGQGDVQDGGGKKQDGQADRRVKEALLDTAFGAENGTFTAKRHAEAGAPLLQ